MNSIGATDRTNGQDLQETGEDAATRRPSSRIQRCVRDGAAVYEKQYLPDDWGGTEEVVRERAKREVELIELLESSQLFGGELGLVKIESSVPADATIATYEIAGRDLDQWIRQSVPLKVLHFRSADGEPLDRAMELAGRWLQKFQSIPLTESCRVSLSQLDPSSLKDYCALRLDSLGDYGYRWPDRKTRDRILDRLDHLEQPSSSRADAEEVWVHADYAPGNILWDGTTATPIDFAMARAGRRLDDVTYFIHRLEMQQVYRPWRAWPLSSWREAFLKGYGQPDANQSPLYQALMIKNLVCRLHTYVRRPAKNMKQALHDRWVRRVLRQKLAAL